MALNLSITKQIPTVTISETQDTSPSSPQNEPKSLHFLSPYRSPKTTTHHVYQPLATIHEEKAPPTTMDIKRIFNRFLKTSSTSSTSITPSLTD
jgi:hypothetical protein